MNAQNLEKHFRRRHLEYHFTALEIAIFSLLKWKCDDLWWKMPFNFRCEDLRREATEGAESLKSEKAFNNARNRLKQAGIIDYKNGNGRGNTTRYWLFENEKDSEKHSLKGSKFDPLSDTLSDTLSEGVSDTLSGVTTINQTKPNQTEDSSRTKRTVSHKAIELSESAQKFADWFRGLLPPSRDTTESDLRAWAKTYDELVTIDKREKSEIKAVVLWARQNDFWKTNFLSATKLRHKDKTGTKFYDVFLNKMKAEHDATHSTNGNGVDGNALTPYQQRQHNGQRSVTTLVENARDFAASLT